MPEAEPNAISASLSPSRVWRSILSLVLLVLWISFMVCLYFIVKIFIPSKLESSYKLFHRGCCWLFSVDYKVIGDLSRTRPTLFLCNHISYIDVFLLGSVIPGYFIAKSEVANWPVMGALAKLQNTLFFERKGVRIRDQLNVMSKHFEQKGNLILFPEGTSTEGEHVEPFKSSLLQSVENADIDVLIQPVTIAYVDYRGQAMTRTIRDHYAWYATMPFVSHFFSALGMQRASAQLIFHSPVTITDFETRKDCARHCHKKVQADLDNALK